MRDLYQKYLENSASEEELKELFDLIKSADAKRLEELVDYGWEQSFLSEKVMGKGLDANAVHPLPKRSVKGRIFARKWLVAASVLLVAGASILLWNSSLLFPVISSKTSPNAYQINPGTNRAVLLLADGTQHELLESQDEIIIEDAKIAYQDGQVLHAQSPPTGTHLQELNTISTPKGGQYKIVLPDKSKVWINASTTLKYAALNFKENRYLELDGEAYFEVAKDKNHPFQVQTKNQTLRVLGTAFNLNAYPDEVETITTLKSGLVALQYAQDYKQQAHLQPIQIHPGEQSVLQNQSARFSTTEIQVDDVIAWKNGKFVFDSESLPSIMRKLARWYNVEVLYEADFSQVTFTGSISRYEDIREILDKITYTKAATFKVLERRIIVMK